MDQCLVANIGSNKAWFHDWATVTGSILRKLITNDY